jgi:hypothetical protein
MQIQKKYKIQLPKKKKKKEEEDYPVATTRRRTTELTMEFFDLIRTRKPAV